MPPTRLLPAALAALLLAAPPARAQEPRPLALDLTLGLQARADAATPSLGPFALAVSVRGTLAPRVRGQALGAVAFGLGVRIR